MGSGKRDIRQDPAFALRGYGGHAILGKTIGEMRVGDWRCARPGMGSGPASAVPDYGVACDWEKCGAVGAKRR